MKIITISGLDGSGKSTQIEMLKKYLESRSKSFYYFHAVEFSIANRRGLTSTNKKSATKANWFQIQLRKIALLIDIYRFKGLIKKLKVDYIISDRYFYDSVININYLLETRFPKDKKRVSELFAEKFIPKPDHAFYLKTDPEKIMQRDRKPDQGLEYLIKKQELYEDKLKAWDIVVINGEAAKEEIFKVLKSKIQSSNFKSSPND